MGKTLKSVKVEDDLIKIIDMYTSLMKSISGSAFTFTTMVEEGISLFLLEQIQMMKMFMQNKIVMESGVFKTISLTNEQIESINELEAEIAAYRCENKMGGIVVGTADSENSLSQL